jgi:hypothetical protein
LGCCRIYGITKYIKGFASIKSQNLIIDTALVGAVLHFTLSDQMNLSLDHFEQYVQISKDSLEKKE